MGNEKVEALANEYTAPLKLSQDLAPYPYLDTIKTAEGYRAKRYRGKGEEKETIGYGHYIEDDANYYKLAEELGIEDPENLSEPESTKLASHDVDVRRKHMSNEYNGVDQELLDTMLNVRFQFSPEMFDKHFGEALKKKDIPALQHELSRLGNVFKKRGQSGVLKRWVGVIGQLDKLIEVEKPKEK